MQIYTAKLEGDGAGKVTNEYDESVVIYYITGIFLGIILWLILMALTCCVYKKYKRRKSTEFHIIQ